MADWVEIGLRINAEAQEAATEILYNYGAQGLWLEEQGKRVFIKTYFPETDFSKEKLAILKEQLETLAQFGLDPGNVELVTEKVLEADWANSWKEYFYPEKISKNFVVKPTWREYQPQSTEKVIQIDPGMAFGTGTHPSTYLAITALEEMAGLKKIVLAESNMLDVGTGSGILAIAAAMLGIPKITALDIDSVAIQVAKENIKQNRVQKQVEVLRSDLVKRVIDKGQTFQLVTANIIAEIILQLIVDLPLVLDPDGFFLASGIVSPRFSDVHTALLKQGFRLVRILKEGEWIALIAQFVGNGG